MSQKNSLCVITLAILATACGKEGFQAGSNSVQSAPSTQSVQAHLVNDQIQFQQALASAGITVPSAQGSASSDPSSAGGLGSLGSLGSLTGSLSSLFGSTGAMGGTTGSSGSANPSPIPSTCQVENPDGTPVFPSLSNIAPTLEKIFADLENQDTTDLATDEQQFQSELAADVQAVTSIIQMCAPTQPQTSVSSTSP